MPGSTFDIAIDGPVAAGKGTVSKLVAERLNFLYVDTGAMYRMVVLLARENNVDYNDEESLAKLVSESKMEIRPPEDGEQDGRLSTIILNGKDVSWEIRTKEVSSKVALVARLSKVRQELVKKQKEIARNQNVVMEGRDITYVVLPDADLKIYLTASKLVRAKRRHVQHLTKGDDLTFEEVLDEIEKRDEIDMSRDSDPLKIVPEAWVFDTTDISIEKAVNAIVDRVRMMNS